MKRAYKITIAAVIITVGILLRVYVALVIRPINGDSAVFALMAKHMSELKEFYIYMPLLHYAGALSSYIAAILFSVFGIAYNSFITVGLLFSSGGLIAGCILSRKILDGFGEIASDLLIAVPSFLIIWHSLLAGVHAENALFIPILLLLAVKINSCSSARAGLLAIISGVISGLALWSTPGSAPAVLTIMTLLFMTRRPRLYFWPIVLFFIGILIGYAPAVIYNTQYPHATLFRMFGRILNLDKSALSSPDMLALVMKQIFWRISTVPESLYRIPRLISELISFPGMLLFLASAVIVLYGWLRRAFENKRTDGIGVVLLYVFWFVTFYALLVGENASRYMIPLVIVSPLLIGSALSRISKQTGTFLMMLLVGSLLYYNISTVRSSYDAYNPGRYIRLTDWLVKNGQMRGYSDYDTAYIAEIESLGKVTLSPTLYHPTFSDRWPDETKVVRGSDNVCYIIDGRRALGAIDTFEDNLARLGLPFVKDKVDVFTVYCGIPGAIRPEDLMPAKRE